jgi:osmotically inducible lipoprotein OsmB
LAAPPAAAKDSKLEGINMKTKFISAAVLAVSLLGLGGCATMDRQTVGTVGGAVAGGLIGSAVGGTGATIAGAAIGGVVGNQAAKR